MEAQALIDKILSAKSLSEILDIEHIDSEYKPIVVLIHPDRCKLPNADEAIKRLNQLKEEFINGKLLVDDAGEFSFNGYKIISKGDPTILKWSLFNYNELMKRGSEHFKKYLPKSMRLEGDKLTIVLNRRCVPLSSLQPLPQEHVNWILSRMIEFSSLMHKEVNGVHCGLNPYSVFISPDNHGIQVVSFYHFTLQSNKVGTISGKYKNWYPSQLFRDKIAQPYIDIELAKRNAAFLLGDNSGLGIKYKATHNKDFIDFLTRFDSDSEKAFYQYRDLLKKNFETKFHLLNI